jgi:hypothetical protein
MTCLGVSGLASEEAGKSSRGGGGCQGRRRLPNNETDCSVTCLGVPRLGILGGREELQVKQRTTRQVAITQQKDRLVYRYSTSYKDIPHSASEDVGKSSKGARGSKGC